MFKKLSWILGLLLVFSLVLSACGEEPTPEPTPEPVTEEPVVTEEPEPEPEEPMDTPTPEVIRPTPEVIRVEPEVVVEFWTTDNEEERVNRYEEIAERFMEEHPEIDVRIIPIEEAGVSQRMATALAANRLPDIIRMGVERVAAFAADDILDEEAATAVVQAVGEDDFRDGPLQMVTNPATGGYSAIPYDGWIQAIWYREDVFDQLGLPAPVTWEEIDAACDQLPGTEDLLYAIGLGTDPGQNYGHQVFEQVAISNDAWPFDAEGNVTMNTPEMVAALDFYASLQRCAIPGPQYWRGAREAYELGQSGMLFYSTYIMDDLVEGSGTEDGQIQIAVDDLAQKTGFAPRMAGPNGEATYGQLVTLAIPQGADPEAQMVAEYFLQEGYQEVLALAPFGKVPVLESAVDEWMESSDYFQYYSAETLQQIANGYDSMQRWLFRPGYSEMQRAVIGDIEGRLLIPQVISNIAIEGTMTPEEGAAWLQERVEEIVAERQ